MYGTHAQDYLLAFVIVSLPSRMITLQSDQLRLMNLRICSLLLFFHIFLDRYAYSLPPSPSLFFPIHQLTRAFFSFLRLNKKKEYLPHLEMTDGSYPASSDDPNSGESDPSILVSHSSFSEPHHSPTIFRSETTPEKTTQRKAGEGWHRRTRS